MAKLLSILVMCFCLVFLTGVNYIVYANPASAAVIDELEWNEEGSIPVPVEEKTSEGSSLSILEEFLHDSHNSLHNLRINKLHLHKIHLAQELQPTHNELISPPPERLIN